MIEFVHLHTHSDFSLLDGAASIKNLVSRAREFGMQHLAITDHGNMFGVLKFYKECKKYNIKPIIGSEFYVAPSSRFNKTGGDKQTRYFHLVLLAENETGYRNILKLSSLGYTEGFYYKPRIDDELIREYKEGLICLSGCIAGEIPYLILKGKETEAAEKALYYKEIFGTERFYLELQDHGMQEQKQVNRALISISRKTGIPVVATNDIHYIKKDDARAQDILICIGTNKKVTDGKRIKFAHPEFYFKSQDEMASIFHDVPDALHNTIKIAEMCNLTIPLSGPKLPDYKIPKDYTIKTFLTHIAQDGLNARYKSITVEMQDRLNYEISIICSMGFGGYFLIVWDFIQFARKHDIPVGPGRGSGAGSLVAYSLRITDIDPLKYGLLFERFLNPERVSMPDFDIDFCIEKRGDVIDYVTQKYGKEKVGQIITFGTLKAKAVIRDVARVLDFPYSEADKIAKLVPTGPNFTLDQALKNEPGLREIVNQSEKNKELIEISKKLEGLSRHASTHAAGVVIGKEELTNYVPLYRDPKTGSISTQFTMDFLEDCGLVKMDFLGLKTLTIIDKTCKMIKNSGMDFDITQIPNKDPVTFALLCEGKSACVFQFESQGMQGILKRAKPNKIEDLIALNALYRPGPMENIDQYIDSKSGRRNITYTLPDLEPILKETYGVIVYQEQVMEIARKIAGYSLGQADILRRAMGKKKKDIMDKQKEMFIQGASKKGYSKKDAIKIFNLLIPFAGYGFNKSHAAAYSILAYQTAYLKANYPAEFMASILTAEINNTDKLSQYIAESREMGVDVLPPNINISEKDFTVLDHKIIYGLCGIKNVGSAAVDNIIKERNRNGSYENINDFLERICLKTVNRKVLESFIQTGVLDKFNENRATLFYNLDRLIEMANCNKDSKAHGQISLFDSTQIEELTRTKLDKMEEWPQPEILRLEKQNLGFFFSGHPLDDFKHIISKYTNLNLSMLKKTNPNKSYTLIGILHELKVILTKKGRKMAFCMLEDYNGSIELVVFSDVFDKYKDLLINDNIICVSGKLDNSRDDETKLLVDIIKDPLKMHNKQDIPKKNAMSVHIRFSNNLESENNLYELRNYILNKTGKCTLYFHLSCPRQTTEKIVRASSNITVSDDNDVLEYMRQCQDVIEVWKQ